MEIRNKAPKYTMKQAAELADLPLTTLQHYGRIGLLSFVSRTRSGYRVFSERDVMLLRILARLTGSGVTLAEARKLTDLTAQGDATLPQRLAFFQAKKTEMEGRLSQIEQAIASVDDLCAYYESAIEAGGEASVRDPRLL